MKNYWIPFNCHGGESMQGLCWAYVSPAGVGLGFQSDGFAQGSNFKSHEFAQWPNLNHITLLCDAISITLLYWVIKLQSHYFIQWSNFKSHGLAQGSNFNHMTLLSGLLWHELSVSNEKLFCIWCSAPGVFPCQGWASTLQNLANW